MVYKGRAAVQRALNMVGKPYSVGWCQAFTVGIFGTGGVGDWDGDGACDAEDGWKKAVAKGKAVPASKIKSLNDIPAAVMLYWGGGSHDNGHATVGIGNGMMVSTDLPTSGRVGKVPISQAHSQWGLPFLGYVTKDGNGNDLGSYTEAKTTTAKTTTSSGTLYHVNTRSGLYARKTANGANVIRDGKKLLRPYNFTVKVVATKTAGGKKWAKGSGGLWYAAQYLTKGKGS